MISRDKRNLLEKALPDDSFFLLVGNKEKRRNGDVYYPFRQDSDMLLLTEVASPDIVLTCRKHASACEWRIFSDPLSDHEKLWGTDRFSYPLIAEISGIEKISPLSTLSPYISEVIEDIPDIYTTHRDENPYFEELTIYDATYHPLYEVLEPLRMIKTDEEVENIRKAIAVTGFAYEKLRKNIRPGMYEYEVEALVAGVFREHHLIEAYPTIVASAGNACTLHYTSHTRQIESGDLVLVDFGAEYHGYAADITRIFPVGEFSERQLAVYESVLSVKGFAMGQLRPGIKKSEYESQVREKMNEELVKLGLIPTDASDEEKEKLSRKYYPHSTSHFLGLDVHDVGARDTILAPGMIVTCEPGIYIIEEDIGIRLEDDMLITEHGSENLSENILCTLL